MNNIAKMELPVSFDSLNDAIVDAKGRTICLFSWPQCGLDVLTVKERAIHFVKMVNGEKIESIPPVAVQTVVSQVTKSSDGLVSGAKELLNKVFSKKKVVKKAKNYKWVDVNGNDVQLRGRPWHGERKVYFNSDVSKNAN